MLLLAILSICAHAAVISPSDYLVRRHGTSPANEDPNPSTAPFYVRGSDLPKMPAGLGDSHAGLLPISDDPEESRKLFFWYWKSEDASSEDLTIWLNGGPGCSSLLGFLEENGPVIWNPEVTTPKLNPYSWNKISNILYVEQPIGTGFSQGVRNIKNEDELAEQFLGFFDQFRKKFTETAQMNTYVTGESYAGVYVPYIANAMLEHKDKGLTDYKLTGTLIIDGVIGNELDQQLVHVYPYALRNNQYLRLSASTLETIAVQDKSCGYEAYREKYFKFPGQEPVDEIDYNALPDSCDIFDLVVEGATAANKCFNVYNIPDTCSLGDNPLGDGNAGIVQKHAYFLDPAVQKVLHVPPTKWTPCVTHKHTVFENGGGDPSVASISGPLPRVIENSVRTIIANGDQDFLIPTNGVRTCIQQMAWHGKYGFDNGELTPYVVNGQVAGAWQKERELTFVEIYKAGHELPEFAPEASFKMFQYLLGKIPSL